MRSRIRNGQLRTSADVHRSNPPFPTSSPAGGPSLHTFSAGLSKPTGLSTATEGQSTAASPRSTSCYDFPMARDITQRQLRNDSGEIMRGLDRGETFVVSRNGVPVGELTPLRRHRFVSADATIAMFRGAPGVELARLRTDLDRVASQDPNPSA